MVYKNYSWHESYKYSQDPNKVGAEFEQIEKEGELTGESIVEYAKNNMDSTIASMLEWDDSIAGEKYRLHQARSIISNIKVDYITKDDEAKPIRAFVKITRAKDDSYKSIETIISDTDKYQLLLNKAYKELNSIKNRYQELQEIRDLLKDIPEVN